MPNNRNIEGDDLVFNNSNKEEPPQRKDIGDIRNVEDLSSFIDNLSKEFSDLYQNIEKYSGDFKMILKDFVEEFRQIVENLKIGIKDMTGIKGEEFGKVVGFYNQMIELLKEVKEVREGKIGEKIVKEEGERLLDIINRLKDVIGSKEISKEDIINIIEDLEKSRGFEENKEFNEWIRNVIEKLKEFVEIGDEAKSGLRELLINQSKGMQRILEDEYERKSESFWDTLKKGIRFKDINKDFGDTVSEVGQLLYTFLGVRIATSVAELVKGLLKFEDSLTKVAIKLERDFALGMTGVMSELQRLDWKALEEKLKSIAVIFKLTEDDIIKFVGTLRSSGMLFETEQGKVLQEIIKGYKEGTISLDTFGVRIKELISVFWSLEFVTGVARDNIIKLTEDWTKILRTTDVEKGIGSFAFIYESARELGINFENLNSLLTGVVKQTNLYGIDLFSLSLIMKDFKDLIRYNLVAVEDFTNVLVRSRENLNPDKSGSLLWFLSNYGASVEIRGLAEKFLSQGMEGIIRFSEFMKMPIGKLEEIWPKMIEDVREKYRLIMETLGIDASVINKETFRKLAEIQANILDQSQKAVFEMSDRFGSGVMDLYVGMQVLQQSLGVSYKSMGDFGLSVLMTDDLMKGFNENIEEFNKIINKTFEYLHRVNQQLMDNQSLLQSFSKIWHDFLSDLYSTKTSMERFPVQEFNFLEIPESR